MPNVLRMPVTLPWSKFRDAKTGLPITLDVGATVGVNGFTVPMATEIQNPLAWEGSVDEWGRLKPDFVVPFLVGDPYRTWDNPPEGQRPVVPFGVSWAPEVVALDEQARNFKRRPHAPIIRVELLAKVKDQYTP